MRTKKISISKLAFLILAITSSLFSQQESNGKYADVNGMKMYYEVSGEGDPMIVLHGSYMNIPYMGEIIPMLAKTHKVYAIEI